MHPSAASLFGLEKAEKLVVIFGSGRIEANLILSDTVNENHLSLSNVIADGLNLPLYTTYEIIVQGNELKLGPCIGLLLSARSKKITLNRLEKARLYVTDYDHLHGAVVAFDLSGVDRSKHLITGYCYNPLNDSFEPGTFPYPDAVYRKTGLSEEWKKHLLSITGNTLFNNPYHSKWQINSMLSREEDLLPYLPYTEIYHTTDRAFELLDKYGSIYFKPLFGLRGHSVIRLTKTDEGWLLEYRQEEENSSTLLGSKEDAAAALSRLLTRGRFLVQQGIDLITLNKRLIDFRCIMQKSHIGVWECMAIVGRMGVRNSVVSNVSSGGRAMRMKDALNKIDGLYDWDVDALPERMTALALKVCKRLDDEGAMYGMLGLDIGVDTKGKLWVIEVNNRDPDPSIALNIHDRKLYVELKSNLMRYAKWLAGF